MHAVWMRLRSHAQVQAVPVVALRRRRLLRGRVGGFLCPGRRVESMRRRGAIEYTCSGRDRGEAVRSLLLGQQGGAVGRGGRLRGA